MRAAFFMSCRPAWGAPETQTYIGPHVIIFSSHVKIIEIQAILLSNAIREGW